jgi:DNA-nicking Smr family endonuclease
MAAANMSEAKRGSRRLHPEERKLWGEITRSVAPLRRVPAEGTSLEAAGKTAPSSKVAARAAPAVGRPASRLEPFDRRLKQRLARGSEPLDGRIDLHGKTQTEAHAALLSFLRRAQEDGAKFVLVITGKGRRAHDELSELGVLKRQVPHWLRLPQFRAYVSGVEDAHVGHGGAGALYVRIRRAKLGARNSPDS